MGNWKSASASGAAKAAVEDLSHNQARTPLKKTRGAVGGHRRPSWGNVGSEDIGLNRERFHK